MAWDDAPLRAVLAAAPAPRDPHAAYRERLAYFTVHRDVCNRQRYLWANLSVVTFLGGVTLLLIALFGGGLWWALG
ncbi:MAG: hypothetical protein ACRDID_17550, partial [Ktedonobacterales bacterium]